jgi:Reverse transcriptase (RNA-dependent DNA polymerase)
MFVKRRQGKIVVLIIYVNDMIITGDDKKEIESLEKNLCKEFKMKNFGEGGLKYFRGDRIFLFSSCNFHMQTSRNTHNLKLETRIKSGPISNE